MEKARILIVEDEAIIAMEIENQLQSLGYEVTSIVDTGEKAIKKADEDKPDLILMDIRIKGEMDGIDTAEEIRNRFGIPVIFSTAYLDKKRIERAKITMPFGYVLKPMQERDLKVTIEMAMYVSKVDLERRKAEEIVKKKEHQLSESQ
jgi:CheY-like chemotaxis protein